MAVGEVRLLEDGGIEAFLRRQVLPRAADAWYVPESVKIGYEISFTRHFYKPQPLRTWRGSALTFWRWRGRPKAYWTSCWVRGRQYSKPRSFACPVGAVMLPYQVGGAY